MRRISAFLFRTLRASADRRTTGAPRRRRTALRIAGGTVLAIGGTLAMTSTASAQVVLDPLRGSCRPST